MHQIKTIIPVSLFKKDTQEYLSRIELMNEPILLTLYGRAAFVVQHLNSYMNLAQLADSALHQRSVDGMLERMQDNGFFKVKD